MSNWYEKSFGEDYLLVYKHRDFAGAYEEVKQMMSWLNLPQGAKVFDLCCGMGRHSSALADFGYEVTGMDLSTVLLREARKSDHKRRVTWLQGDMRQVPNVGPFAAVVNLFTSFGYFEQDEENAKVFTQIDKLLETEGKFIIDFLNAEYVKKHLVPSSERKEGETLIQEFRTIESGFVCKRINIRDHSEVRQYVERVKLYGLEDFKAFLSKTTLVIDHVYGNYEGAPYDANTSKRLIIVGHKEG